ncbi:HTH-like domain protein [Escherichia coli 2-210-07_S3_C3]|nr:HTH-like domain protein [Escherichia coli 2-210-07_S3_C3]
MKYVFIEKHQAEFSIKAMCRVLRVARSGWYTWCQRRTRISTRQQFRQHCDSVVLAAFTRSKQRYGAPRLTDELRAQGYPFNVKTVAASLRRQGLRAKASRKFSPVSYRAHGLPEVQPGQLPRTRPACVRKSVGAGFLRQWPEPEVGRRHHVLTYR